MGATASTGAAVFYTFFVDPYWPVVIEYAEGKAWSNDDVPKSKIPEMINLLKDRGVVPALACGGYGVDRFYRKLRDCSLNGVVVWHCRPLLGTATSYKRMTRPSTVPESLNMGYNHIRIPALTVPCELPVGDVCEQKFYWVHQCLFTPRRSDMKSFVFYIAGKK